MPRKGGVPANLKPQKKGDKSLNPNGRPPRTFTLVNRKLKEEGFEVLTRTQLMEAVGLMMSLPMDKLREVAKDIEMPMAIRIVASELLEPETAYRTYQDSRDWNYGKATQLTEVTGKDGAPLHAFIWDKLYDKDQDPGA